MSIEIRCLPVGTADATVIKIEEKGQNFNLLIDSGTKKYYSLLKKELLIISESEETVYSWIITHWDNDHIGGFIEFMKDPDFQKDELIQNIWFNANYDMPNALSNSSGYISVKQAETVRDFILRSGKIQTMEVTTEKGSFAIPNGKITFLSPTRSNLKNALKSLSPLKSIRSSENSNLKTVEELKGQKFVPDRSPVNRSCIACVLEYAGRSFAFFADSSPIDTVPALRALGISEEEPLQLTLMQVAHHGSKKNTSEELLNLCRVKDYFISGDGSSSSRLPDKETLVRIITHSERIVKMPITIYLINKSRHNENLFTIDGEEVFTGFNFKLVRPENEDEITVFQYT
jgi:beta-lactamase superfamily II metal-dependent hydrolase